MFSNLIVLVLIYWIERTNVKYWIDQSIKDLQLFFDLKLHCFREKLQKMSVVIWFKLVG
jgi:hypothetical protein